MVGRKWGNDYDVYGGVSGTGYISGGFAIPDSEDMVAEFDGQLTATGGSGEWRDKLDCSGTWEAIKK